jgi:hypothetical protein
MVAQPEDRPAGRLPWFLAVGIGCLGACAWWFPPSQGEPIGTVIAWVVWLSVAVLSAVAAYPLGVRGRTLLYVSLVGAASTFLALPLVLGTLFMIALLIDAVLG